MATTACPACGLTVPYFCCEGLVCPACGYDEELPALPASDAGRGQHSSALHRATTSLRFRRSPVTYAVECRLRPGEFPLCRQWLMALRS